MKFILTAYCGRHDYYYLADTGNCYRQYESAVTAAQAAANCAADQPGGGLMTMTTVHEYNFMDTGKKRNTLSKKSLSYPRL